MPIYGMGIAARNPVTKHCWIQHMGRRDLTLGLTWLLLQLVVTLPAHFSATRSTFLLGNCNIPQCSQRRVSGENRQGSVLQWWEQSVFTRQTVIPELLSMQNSLNRRKDPSLELSIHICKKGRTAEVLLLTLLKLDQSYFFLQEVIFSSVTESK